MELIEFIFSGYFSANQSYLPLLATPQSSGDFTGSHQSCRGDLHPPGVQPRLPALRHLEVHQSWDPQHDQRPHQAQQSLRALQGGRARACCLDVDIQVGSVQSRHTRLVYIKTFLQVMDQRGCWTRERLTEIKAMAASCSEELWRKLSSWDWCLVFILRTITRSQKGSLENLDLFGAISPSGFFTALPRTK